VSGVAIVRYLLANNAPVVAVVPAARIMAGDLPVGTAIPAISVTQIDSLPLNTLRINESPKRHTDRVQVTVYRKGEPDDRGYPGLRTLLNLILAACPGQRGTVNGFAVESIIPDIEGPDIPIPEERVFTRSRDFLVSYS
jgi:hypothetical protein